MKEGDMVVSNGKYVDIQRRFGDTPHRVVAIGTMPSCKKPMVWLDCGGGGFLADGFRVVDSETDNKERSIWMKHKYMITVEAPYVKADTEKLMREIARRNKAEFLGSRKLKSGGYQCGLSCTDKAFGKIKTAVSLTNNGNCLFKDCGEDDGKRKSKPTEAAPAESEPAPKPVQRARRTREAKAECKPVCPGIPPISEQFKKWDDIGSPAHKRAIRLLGAGCENREMKWWGKFSICRHHLYSVLRSLLEDAESKKWMEANKRQPKGFYEYYNTNWSVMRPLVYKAFSKSDAKFIEWHTTHCGRRPADV